MACNLEQDRTKNIDNNKDSIEEKNISQSKKVQIKEEKYVNKGVLIGDTILLYNDNLQPIKNISSFNEKIVNIIGKSDKRINLLNDNEECNEYYFVKISIGDIEGWTNGKYIFEFKQSDLDTIINLASNSYSLITTKDFGIGVTNDIGLSGCGEFYPVVWYEKKKDTYNLISFENTIDVGRYGFKYFCLRNDEGGMDQIKSINISDTITINFERPMQIAQATYKLKIFTNNNNKLIGSVLDFKLTR